MIRVVIFGNSGSGKSTLASSYAKSPHVHPLDLDTIAWKAPAVREDVEESLRELRAFISDHDEWVIEGCYGSLIAEAATVATELLFLNPGTAACQENCRARPWERHKFPTKEAQDRNLDMLLSWVADYETRTDEFSLSAHKEIFDSYRGAKQELTSNRAARDKAAEAGGERP